jgi:hypothetical protein
MGSGEERWHMNIPKKIVQGPYEQFKKFIMDGRRNQHVIHHQKNKLSPSSACLSDFFSEDKDYCFLGASHPKITTEESLSSILSLLQHGEQKNNEIINKNPNFFIPISQDKNKKGDDQDQNLSSPHHQLTNLSLIKNGVDIIL